MKIIQKIAQKNANIFGSRQPVIACLGDSVTNGCFELYATSESSLDTIFQTEYAYSSYLQQRLREVFPAAPAVMINAGISGDTATQALSRLDRDVLSYKPDLVIVCFGLNDCASGRAGKEGYISSMRKIIRSIKQSGAEVIVMTPNAMANHLSVHVQNNDAPFVKSCIQASIEIYNQGVLDEYMDALRSLCAEESVPVCDAYKRWKRLEEQGTDVTELLSNHINHPTRAMQAMFAEMLFGVMVESD